MKAMDQLDINIHDKNLQAPKEASDKFKFKSGGVKRFTNTKKTGMKFKALKKTEAELKQDAYDEKMMKADMEKSEKNAKRRAEWLAKKAAMEELEKQNAEGQEG